MFSDPEHHHHRKGAQAETLKSLGRNQNGDLNSSKGKGADTCTDTHQKVTLDALFSIVQGFEHSSDPSHRAMKGTSVSSSIN